MIRDTRIRRLADRPPSKPHDSLYCLSDPLTIPNRLDKHHVLELLLESRHGRNQGSNSYLSDTCCVEEQPELNQNLRECKHQLAAVQRDCQIRTVKLASEQVRIAPTILA